MEGVLGTSNFHCWQLKSGVNVCSLHVQASHEANEQVLRHRIQQALKAHDLQQITVQVEKDHQAQIHWHSQNGEHPNNQMPVHQQQVWLLNSNEKISMSQ